MSNENIHRNQKSILIASIIADVEITKIHRGSRRKNNSYREHFSLQQIEYRIWKMNQLPELLNLTEKSQCLRSKSDPLFTSLYPLFYDQNGEKHIPKAIKFMHFNLLPHCPSMVNSPTY